MKTSPSGFIAGTLILLADETERKIEDIHPGDQVLCFDDKGRIRRSRVVGIESQDTREYFILDFGFSGSERLRCAREQVIQTAAGPVACGKIFEGAYIKEYRDGWHEREVKVKSRVQCGHTVKVFTLEVAEYQTFFANRKGVKGAV